VYEERRCPSAGIELVLRPNRSLTRRGLAGFYLLMSGASLAVAASSAAQGNVFAPFFAVAELSFLALCLWLVWKAGEREERILLSAGRIEVVREPGGQRFQFHPFWARIFEFPEEAGGRRLRIGSHGRFAELGSFLPDAEREQLASRLRALLADLRVSLPPD
jgi:uncharacterized membrane protein